MRTYLRSGLPFLLWGGLLLLGFGNLATYMATPGEAGVAPAAWPENAVPDRDASVATLLLFAHPRCPCTRASLAELEEVLRRTRQPVRAYVLFQRPAGVAVGWERTEAWQIATRIPAVTALVDPGGAAATLFGAHTSGQVLLYDRSGLLAFAGGITAARGQAGPSVGRARLLAALEGSAPGGGTGASGVYGCALEQAPRDASPVATREGTAS